MTTSLITLSAIGRVFETEELRTHALRGIDLTIDAGEFVAIQGTSGSGKSTLLALLGLLDVPSEGTYSLSGRPTAGLDARARARLRNEQIGFIFQSFHLLGDLTVFENVELPLVYRGMPRAERAERVKRALDKVGMNHRRGHLPSQLSGGQQQRVAVARAVCGDPTILLADEPTGNLDSANGDAVMALLVDLNRAGTTVCMVTHDPSHARYASRSLTLSDGQIVADDAEPPRELAWTR